jgi:hypothetical protein
MGIFEESQAEAAQDNRSWVLQVKVGGSVQGVMVYTIKGTEMMNYTLQANRFYYRTSQAKYLMLEWLARHIDQAGNARVWIQPTEQPNTWFPDMRPTLEPAFVAAMGRVLDVAGLCGLPVGTGTFTAEVVDPDCPWNQGVWTFACDGGKLEVIPALVPECRLSIQGLSALVYGVNDPADFPHRGWGDPSPELVEVMRRMFPPALPFLHEQY